MMKAVPFISFCAVAVAGASGWMLMQEGNDNGKSAFASRVETKEEEGLLIEGNTRVAKADERLAERPMQNSAGAALRADATPKVEATEQGMGLERVLTSAADVKALPGYSPEKVDRRPSVQRYSDVQIPLILKDPGSAVFLGSGSANDAPPNGSSAEGQLTPEQQQAIDRLRDEFAREIGGENQNPDDPAYRARWQRVQPRFDERLKIMLGIEKFNQYQIDLAQKEAARQI